MNEKNLQRLTNREKELDLYVNLLDSYKSRNTKMFIENLSLLCSDNQSKELNEYQELLALLNEKNKDGDNYKINNISRGDVDENDSSEGESQNIMSEKKMTICNTNNHKKDEIITKNASKSVFTPLKTEINQKDNKETKNKAISLLKVNEEGEYEYTDNEDEKNEEEN